MSVKQPGMSNAEYLRALRQRAVEQGKCYVCRARQRKPNCRLCQSCIDRAKEVERSRVRRRVCTNCCCNLPVGRTQQLCPSCTEATSEQAKARAAALAADGKCTRCGDVDAVAGRRLCVACAETTRLRMLAMAREQGREAGVKCCSVCTAIGLPGLSHNSRTHARYMALAAHWEGGR